MFLALGETLLQLAKEGQDHPAPKAAFSLAHTAVCGAMLYLHIQGSMRSMQDSAEAIDELGRHAFGSVGEGVTHISGRGKRTA